MYTYNWGQSLIACPTYNWGQSLIVCAFGGSPQLHTLPLFPMRIQPILADAFIDSPFAMKRVMGEQFSRLVQTTRVEKTLP